MTQDFQKIFTQETLLQLFPAGKANMFFEALYGDTEDGAYDISLEYNSADEESLHFEFHLNQRPGKCLVCNLTYGLPSVFSKHPIIDINGIVEKITSLLGEKKASAWKLGATHEISRQLHVIPLTISQG